MILPGSYHNGFAPRDGEPLYPELWVGCTNALCPSIGPTGPVLRDWAGRQKHATLTSMDPGTDWIVHGGRYALDMDGVDDRTESTCDIPFSTASQQWTLSTWAYIRAIEGGTSAPLITIGTANYQAVSMQVYLYRMDLIASSGGTSWTIGVSSPVGTQTITTGKWYHFAAVRRGVNVEVWVNGVLDGTASHSSGFVTNNNTMRTGSHYALNNTLMLDGLQDDIRAYDRALLPQELALLASRRGIAYELRRKPRLLAQVQVGNRRRRLLISGVTT